MNHIGELSADNTAARAYLNQVRAVIVAAAYLAYRDERLVEQIDAEYPILEPYCMEAKAAEPVLELLKENHSRLIWPFKRKSTLNEWRENPQE